MSKADKHGWIRHRGGKCPVGDYTPIEYRMRDGQTRSTTTGGMLSWEHEKWASDIMRYRLHKPAEQDQSELRKKAIEEAVGLARFKPVEHPVNQVDPSVVVIDDHICVTTRNDTEFAFKPAEQPDPEAGAKAAAQAAINPIEWRDRIHEIDRTVEALEEERVSLVQRLADEGFKLIGKINEGIADAKQAHEDMSDWRNWKVGDLVECLNDHPGQFTKGKLYKIKAFNTFSVSIELDDGGSDTNGWQFKNFKFHSRPSA